MGGIIRRNRNTARPRDFAEAGRTLLAWYSREARVLPWRGSRDPYAIWVSEVMLQQTRVETVIPYYARFLERFPDPASLAAAPEDELLKHWEGLGYYRRARHLHQAVREVVGRYGGKVPGDYEELRGLPGVGDYTAAAVASIAFGQARAAVDGNILRVVTRLAGLRERIDKPATKRSVAELVLAMIPQDGAAGLGAGELNQALMDLGAGICSPRTPDCAACPLAGFCIAHRDGLVDRIPATPKKAAPRPLPCAFAVLRRGGRVALTRRPGGGLLGGLMAFPGAEGADDAASLASALRESHGIESKLDGKPVLAFKHSFSHLRWEAKVYEGKPAAGQGRNLSWLRPADLAEHAIPTAHRRIVDLLLQR